MIYDGECGFCRQWIEKWRRITKDSVMYEPYQNVLERYPDLTEKQCREAVQLVTPEGRIFAGAHAVFAALALSGSCRWLLWLYDHGPLFGRASERVYRIVARHRSPISEPPRSPTCEL